LPALAVAPDIERKESKVKSIICRNPHLAVRIVASLILQVILVVVLRGAHQEVLWFNLPSLGRSLLASGLYAARPGCPKLSTKVMLWLLSLSPQLGFMATLLHLLGWHQLFDRLQSSCPAFKTHQ
jgi:hypothetical protein